MTLITWNFMKNSLKCIRKNSCKRLWIKSCQFLKGRSKRPAVHYSLTLSSEMGGTILGISPGTKYMGVAMLRNGTLHDWKVKHYKGAWSDEKLSKATEFLESLIIRHVVTHIACKVPHSSRCSKALNVLLEKIKRLAKEYKLKLHIYSIEEIKQWFKSNIRNRKSLSAHMTSTYPELTKIYLREKQIRNNYYFKVFEAVAALTHCHNTIG